MRKWRVGLIVVSCVCLGAAPLFAQVEGFDDNFSENPFDEGWIQNGVAQWVPPPGDAPECVDDNTVDPLDPCSVYNEAEVEELPDLQGSQDPIADFGGYVLITPGQLNQAGNVFRAEPNFYDNFKLEVVIELRDGTIGRPADGMTVVVVGGEDPPNRTGTGGGGMGAPCVGITDTEPQLTWEFDNWSGNTGDNNNGNHVGFAYSPTGHPCTDAIQNDVFVPIDPNLAPLHNLAAQPAPANRYRMTVYAQNCGGDLTVATDLEAIDGGVNLGRVFTHVIEDFEPFEGYLGVTGSTGDASQNHILHSAKLEPLPDDFCLQPAAAAARDVVIENPNSAICGEYEAGTMVSVTLTVGSIRGDSECCGPATSATIEETVPPGWVISNISGGGTQANGTISWVLSGANLTEGKEVTYTATAGANASGVAGFAGNISDGAGGVKVFITGRSQLYPGVPFDACGRIKCWNILGALGQPAGAAPTEDQIREDYLTDGAVGELEFVFEPGAEIEPDFLGEAASTDIFPDANGRNPDGDAGIATVFKYTDGQDGWINLNDDVFGGDPNNVMAYAQIYIISDQEREVFVACDSDDSIQVILNEEEILINSVARGNDEGCPVGFIPPNRARLRDVTPEPVILEEGENRLIVKTFEGGGGFNFELRFEDEDEKPITAGLSLSHVPLSRECRRAPVVVTRDVDTGREVNGKPVYSGDDLGRELNVTLTLSDVREEDGLCAVPGMVTITDTVPANWTASSASAGGTINGDQVTWTVMAADGATLSYKATPGGDPVNASFSGAVSEDGSDQQFGVRGDRTVTYAPAPFPRGPAVELVSTDFSDDGAGECPDGWICNTGAGLFNPQVNDLERLQMSCDDNIADCGNGATSVLLGESVDLTEASVRIEFDAYFTHPGGDPADAMTVVFLDADDPLTEVADGAVGGAGGGNGYSGLTGFAVEFDFWRAGTDPSGYNSNDWTHIGVAQNGVVDADIQTHLDVLGSNAYPTILGGDGWPEFIDFTGDGIPIHCEIDYNNGNLQVWIEAPETADGAEPAFPRTKVIDTLVTFNTVGGVPVEPGEDPVLRNVWIGFTAGTGGAMVGSEVDDLEIQVFPASGGGGGSSLRPGDVNFDGSVNISDPVASLNHLFGGQDLPECYAVKEGAAVTLTEAGLKVLDWNGDGSHNIADPVASLGAQFGGGTGHALGSDCVTIAGTCTDICQ